MHAMMHDAMLHNKAFMDFESYLNHHFWAMTYMQPFYRRTSPLTFASLLHMAHKLKHYIYKTKIAVLECREWVLYTN